MEPIQLEPVGVIRSPIRRLEDAPRFYTEGAPPARIEVYGAFANALLRMRAGDEITATRGARVVTWKEAERVLAGYPDGRADEGPTSGAPTVLGLNIARDNGWSAPPMPDSATQDSTEEMA